MADPKQWKARILDPTVTAATPRMSSADSGPLSGLWRKAKEIAGETASSLSEQPVVKMLSWLGDLADEGFRGNTRNDPDWRVAGMPDIPGRDLAALGAQGMPEWAYSRVNRIATELPAGRVHPNRLRSLLKSGASQEEISYRGLDKFIDAAQEQPITQEALLQYLRENPPPRVNVLRKELNPAGQAV